MPKSPGSSDILAGAQTGYSWCAAGVPRGLQTIRGRHVVEHTRADADVVRVGGVESVRNSGMEHVLLGGVSCCAECSENGSGRVKFVSFIQPDRHYRSLLPILCLSCLPLSHIMGIVAAESGLQK